MKKGFFRKLACLALVIAVLGACLLLLPERAQAAEITRGTCGDNLTWVLDSDGTLTISGAGAMTDYSTYGAPWYSYCSEITSVVINAGVTSIGSNAFADCYNLTSVTIPDGVTSIGAYAFYYSGLTSVTMPDSVTTINSYAFYGCGSLESVTIPDTVFEIGYSTFANCGSLTGIWVDAGNGEYSSDSQGVLFTKERSSVLQVPGGYQWQLYHPQYCALYLLLCFLGLHNA